MRHEPIDALILKRAFDAIPAPEILAFIKAAPTGAFARRAWFFCETLTRTTLDIEDAKTVTAVDALDPKAYFTGAPHISKQSTARSSNYSLSLATDPYSAGLREVLKRAERPSP